MNAPTVVVRAQEMVAVADLKPYDRNAKRHPPEQITALVRAIREFGWTQPVLIDGEGGLIAGHGRLQAAIALGMEEVPAVRVEGLSDAQRRALVLADNRIAEMGSWDEALLQAELRALAGEDFDVTLTGFDLTELPPLTDDVDEDDAPEPDAVHVVSRAGDLWMLGPHRLICGDSTDPETVATLLDGAAPRVMVTDPPYGVEYDPAWRNDVVRADGSKVAARAVGKVQNDDNADWSMAYALFPGDVAYVWHAGLFADVVKTGLEANGFAVRSQIIWQKHRFVIGRRNYHWGHEPCWYAVRKNGDANWLGGRSQSTFWKSTDGQMIDGNRQTTVWALKQGKSFTGHGTQKPVDCMRRPILNHTMQGESVYEPFSGSGTTIIAAQTCARRAFAVEIDPAYVDLAVRRWQAFTGREAILAGVGKTFAQVAAERALEGPQPDTGEPEAGLSGAQTAAQADAMLAAAQAIADGVEPLSSAVPALSEAVPALSEAVPAPKRRGRPPKAVGNGGAP